MNEDFNKNLRAFNPESYRWNVLDEEEFKARYEFVFNKVAKALTRTFGPYGANTIKEYDSYVTSTKDGWQVLKYIKFNDRVLGVILNTLVDICNKVQTRVGDGTTTSIVSSDKLLTEIRESEIFKTMRPKEFMLKFGQVVDEICKKIDEMSIKIDPEKNLEDIRNIALISTNDDKFVSNMIYDIYVKTNNPVIDFVKSNNLYTTCDIVEGFKIKACYIDGIYALDDQGNNVCKNPYILMFDNTLERSSHTKIINDAANIALDEGRKLFVIAPYYNEGMLAKIQYDVNKIIQETRDREALDIVYCRVPLPNGLDKINFSDFAVFTGGRIITSQDMYEQTETGYDVKEDFPVKEYLGEVGKIRVSSREILINGFYNINQEKYDAVKLQARLEFEKAQEEAEAQAAARYTELYNKKMRLSRLSGKMSVINVGGGSPMELEANYDAVEDATKACESAYKYGYNIGGSLMVPIAIEELRKESKEIDPNREIIMDIIDKAYRKVFLEVLNNKDRHFIGGIDEEDLEKNKAIVEECIKRRTCYDLLTEKYSNRIINPANTDIEILRASSSIIASLMSSNQYLSVVINEQIK